MAESSLVNTFGAVVKHELILAIRRRGELINPLLFFIIVVSLFPLALNSDERTLQHIAPAVIWVAALLASMLALERLFSSDYLDGTLEQMLLSPQPLSIIVLGKVFAHWLLTGLPLIIISPLIGAQFYLSTKAITVMLLTLLIGTPILSLIGAIGSALTLGLRGGGILLALLILPLYIPILVYGAGAITASEIAGTNVQTYFLLLTAFLILALILTPWATAAALRVSAE